MDSLDKVIEDLKKDCNKLLDSREFLTNNEIDLAEDVLKAIEDYERTNNSTGNFGCHS